MRKVTFLMCLSIALTGITTLNAQTKFEVPQNVEFNTKEDYTRYEASVIDAAKWLEETPLNTDKEKRQEVNAFVLKWVSGSPTVTVDIGTQLGKIYGNNAQLLAIYLTSYSRNYLENKGSATKFSATKAGLVSMMNVYKKGIEISKSKEMDKLIKLADENKLDEYIKDKFKL